MLQASITDFFLSSVNALFAPNIKDQNALVLWQILLICAGFAILLDYNIQLGLLVNHQEYNFLQN